MSNENKPAGIVETEGEIPTVSVETIVETESEVIDVPQTEKVVRIAEHVEVIDVDSEIDVIHTEIADEDWVVIEKKEIEDTKIDIEATESQEETEIDSVDVIHPAEVMLQSSESLESDSYPSVKRVTPTTEDLVRFSQMIEEAEAIKSELRSSASSIISASSSEPSSISATSSEADDLEVDVSTDDREFKRQDEISEITKDRAYRRQGANSEITLDRMFERQDAVSDIEDLEIKARRSSLLEHVIVVADSFGDELQEALKCFEKSSESSKTPSVVVETVPVEDIDEGILCKTRELVASLSRPLNQEMLFALEDWAIERYNLSVSQAKVVALNCKSSASSAAATCKSNAVNVASNCKSGVSCVAASCKTHAITGMQYVKSLLSFKQSIENEADSAMDVAVEEAIAKVLKDKRLSAILDESVALQIEEAVSKVVEAWSAKENLPEVSAEQVEEAMEESINHMDTDMIGEEITELSEITEFAADNDSDVDVVEEISAKIDEFDEELGALYSLFKRREAAAPTIELTKLDSKEIITEIAKATFAEAVTLSAAESECDITPVRIPENSPAAKYVAEKVVAPLVDKIDSAFAAVVADAPEKELEELALTEARLSVAEARLSLVEAPLSRNSLAQEVADRISESAVQEIVAAAERIVVESKDYLDIADMVTDFGSECSDDEEISYVRSFFNNLCSPRSVIEVCDEINSEESSQIEADLETILENEVATESWCGCPKRQNLEELVADTEDEEEQMSVVRSSIASIRSHVSNPVSESKDADEKLVAGLKRFQEKMKSSRSLSSRSNSSIRSRVSPRAESIRDKIIVDEVEAKPRHFWWKKLSWKAPVEVIAETEKLLEDVAEVTEELGENVADAVAVAEEVVVEKVEDMTVAMSTSTAFVNDLYLSDPLPDVRALCRNIGSAYETLASSASTACKTFCYGVSVSSMLMINAFVGSVTLGWIFFLAICARARCSCSCRKRKTTVPRTCREILTTQVVWATSVPARLIATLLRALASGATCLSDAANDLPNKVERMMQPVEVVEQEVPEEFEEQVSYIRRIISATFRSITSVVTCPFRVIKAILSYPAAILYKMTEKPEVIPIEELVSIEEVIQVPIVIGRPRRGLRSRLGLKETN